MKKLLIAVAALAVVLFPVSVTAGTYKVKPGDCLIRIASRFGSTVNELVRINRISNPNLIFAGTNINIPGEITDEAVTASPKPFYWKNVNVDPVGPRRSSTIMIDKFSFSEDKKINEEVKKKLIEKVSAKDFRWIGLKDGDYFEQMGFGEYRVRDNVFAAWGQGQLYAARLYEVEHKGRKYFLAEPLVCHNWCWWREKIKKKKLLLLLMPPPIKGQPTETLLVEKKQKEKFVWRPDWETWFYVGHYIGAQEENEHDWSEYYGGNVSFFPHEWRLGNGIFRAGPAFQYVGWRGEADRSVEYWGHMNLFGGEGQFITGDTKTQFKAYFGKKYGGVSGLGFPYEQRQENRILAIEPSHVKWYGDRKWFPEIEVGGRFEFDLDGKRHSSWDGNSIPEADDPADNQSYYSIRAKTEVYQGKYVTPTAELTFGYRCFDEAYHLEPRAGVKLFRNLVETDVSYNIVEGPNNNMVGAHVILNVSDGVKRLCYWLKTKNRGNQADKVKAEEESDSRKKLKPAISEVTVNESVKRLYYRLKVKNSDYQANNRGDNQAKISSVQKDNRQPPIDPASAEAMDEIELM
ncbi:hypothetical protein DRH27_00595 [Candidatus Falkowbacteria bacterium]|nr:MAG: hypothetical protein DRH27_00595 [Candidatus Falkowbacteria bacterium]